jgi:hypothetical protein
LVAGHGAVVHDVRKKQQGVVFFRHAHDFAPDQRHLHVMQQLREHGVAGVAGGVLGFKPDFGGLDVDQALGVALEA